MLKSNHLALLLALLPFAAQADDVSLGVAVAGGQSVYRDYKADPIVLPLVQYQGKVLFVDGTSAGARVLQDGRLSVSLLAELDLNEFDPASARRTEFKLLDKRKMGLLAGVKAEYLYGAQDKLSAELLTDASGHHDATVLGLGWKHAFAASSSSTQYFSYSRLRLNPAAYNDYYYGVSQQESARSGVAAYQAKAAIQLDAGVGMVHVLNQNVALTTLLGVRHIGGNIHDSPLVENATALNGVVGVSYRF